MSFVENVAIQNSYRSDHAGVILTISLSQIKTGRGLWEFDNSLLTDKQYVQTVKEIILKIKAQYMLPVYDVNHINIIPNVEIQVVINDQLFLETLLMEIRGKTISYSAFKNKEKKKRNGKKNLRMK